MIHLKLMSQTTQKPRFATLDVLRGFFILVILVDHLNRFPSWFAWVTGQGRLWVSAGEGFFIISGLLVGYTRGFKKRHRPMKEVIGLLYSRALILYLSAVIASSLLLFLTLHTHFPLALQPSVVVPRNSLTTAIYQIFTLHFVFEWVYFLKFYIASLCIAPAFIWLLRKNQNVVALIGACSLWALGYYIKQDWLQWQILFFVPAVFGYHLESIQSSWRELPGNTRRYIERGIIGLTIVAFVISSFWVFGWVFVKGPHAVMSFDSYIATRRIIDPFFYKVQLSMGRVLLAFVCFAGLYIIVNKSRRYTARYTDWFLIPLGTYSLVAYILHGFILLPIQAFIPLTLSSTFNTILGVITVLLVWKLSQLKIVRRVIPK